MMAAAVELGGWSMSNLDFFGADLASSATYNKGEDNIEMY